MHIFVSRVFSVLFVPFAFRYTPLPISDKAVSFQLQESGPVQSHNLSGEEQEEENLLTDPAEKRWVY